MDHHAWFRVADRKCLQVVTGIRRDADVHDLVAEPFGQRARRHRLRPQGRDRFRIRPVVRRQRFEQLLSFDDENRRGGHQPVLLPDQLVERRRPGEQMVPIDITVKDRFVPRRRRKRYVEIGRKERGRVLATSDMHVARGGNRGAQLIVLECVGIGSLEEEIDPNLARARQLFR